jgi:hypothetical protein
MANIVDLFRTISEGMSADFKAVRYFPQRGESGRATENIVKSFLKKHLPSRFDVCGGFVIGQDGTVSRQADLLVIDAINCPKLLAVEGTGMYPVDGVVALIEVTQRLDSKKARTDAEKIQELRSLKSGLNGFFASDFQDSAPLGVIFAEMSTMKLAKIAQWLAEMWRAAPNKSGLPNAIIVANKGMVLYSDQLDNLHWDPINAKGIARIEGREVVLLLFLLYLMGRARILIEHRIRARARRIIAIRRPGDQTSPEILSAIFDASGAEPYFGDFTEYFSVDDRNILEQLVGQVSITPL